MEDVVMTPENFVYWLQGMLESDKVKTLDEADVQMIKDHLKLVFTKVTPNIGTLTQTTPIPYSPDPNWFKPVCSDGVGLTLDGGVAPLTVPPTWDEPADFSGFVIPIDTKDKQNG
jgi:hypothetical protein